METMSSLGPSSADKQALRLFLTSRGMSMPGAAQVIGAQSVVDRQDRIILACLLCALTGTPSAALIRKPNPGKLNFESYFSV